MENRLKKQLAQIKARALMIAGRAAGENANTDEASREIVDDLVKTGAVVRGADFEPSRSPLRFPWWRRRREARSATRGYEGEFQRILDSLSGEDPVTIESAVPGEAVGSADSTFYLIRANAREIDRMAPDEAAHFSSFNSWPAQTQRTRIGAQPVYGAVVDAPGRAAETSPGSVLFLDIETAGLSANTYVFLVGLMYWAGGEFHVEQAFARDYTEEEGMLHHVRGTMGRFGAVVTYNGAAFDLPFLRTRMAIHRMPDFEPIDSVDLLHAARRTYRPLLPNCRLVTVEKHLRGVERTDDIPSRFIPRAYHEFVRTKDARIMRSVVYHNRMDVFTMAMILNHLGNVAAPGKTPAADPMNARLT